MRRAILSLLLASSPLFELHAQGTKTKPAPPPPAPASRARPPVPTLAPVVQQVAPAVVSVAVQGKMTVSANPLFNDPFFRQFFGAPRQPLQQEFHAAGSGVIVDAKNGYVVTNNHVIQNADRITIDLSDGRELDAKIAGADPATDIAVLQVSGTGLSELKLGNSDGLRVGDFVLAVGNPFGLGGTVTYGIVSAKGRSGLGIEGYEDFIQTDASINPGNSGGALVNLDGELVGINTAIIGPSGGNVGVGLAIPINMVSGVMQQLIKHGRIERGQLGVEAQDVSPQIARALHLGVNTGALVSRVAPGSAAAKAGMKAGDVITAIDSVPVRGAADLRTKIGLRQLGETIRIQAMREGKPLTFTTALATAVAEQISGDSLDDRLAGVTFGTLTEPADNGEVSGIEVEHAAPNSAAYQEGLRQGDIITSVNRQPVTTLSQFSAVVKAAGDAIVFTIVRGDQSFYLAIQ